MPNIFWEFGDGGFTPGAAPPQRTESTARLELLEDRVDRLLLTSFAMWSLIREETNLTEEDLLRRIRDIDLMDGTDDGKVTRQVAKCSACERPMSPRHKRCIYCGSERLIVSAFDTLT